MTNGTGSPVIVSETVKPVTEKQDVGDKEIDGGVRETVDLVAMS